MKENKGFNDSFSCDYPLLTLLYRQHLPSSCMLPSVQTQNQTSGFSFVWRVREGWQCHAFLSSSFAQILFAFNAVLAYLVYFQPMQNCIRLKNFSNKMIHFVTDRIGLYIIY
ncbi:unnamed protein product [Rangifer tarandus platyrhynchus]|uniref:Uncharacterized protein n=1 Tax=Rangifer tarandus platyrhynchus TaxID=3082113 RepID=A0ABN8XU03_RANTA|nr:unnamed protein product [Rangifer tarandus platyrhynchus]